MVKVLSLSYFWEQIIVIRHNIVTCPLQGNEQSSVIPELPFYHKLVVFNYQFEIKRDNYGITYDGSFLGTGM